MTDLQLYLPAKRKTTAAGWISFNAPCCVHNGESADRRHRGGLKTTSDGSWSYHCFNCNFTASFVMGRHLGYRARRLLGWMNVPNEEIERINLESMRHRSVEGLLQDRNQQTAEVAPDIVFESVELDSRLQVITEQAPMHYQYLCDRAVSLNYPYMHDPAATRPAIVIPYTHQQTIVGQTTRFLDNKRPKYIHNMPPGYVFGTDLQHEHWQYAIVVEGVFDALSINGLAVLHSEINDTQVRLIRSLDRAVVVVPDQDAAGLKIIDRAIELGWAVSMPNWPDCKDVNDAVRKYGQLATLLTIMQAKETSRIKIELRRREVAKTFR